MNRDTAPYVVMRVEDIPTREPFSILFPILPDKLVSIAQDMRDHGYDDSQPIVTRAEEGVVVDGHTRLEAAKQAEITQVPVCPMHFPDVRAALEYAIRRQRDRRNLTNAEILRCIEAIQVWMREGRPTTMDWHGDGSRIMSTGTRSEDLVPVDIISQQEAADMLGVSVPTVKRAQTIVKGADTELKEKVITGSVSIKEGARIVQEQQRVAVTPTRRLSAKTQAHVEGTTYRGVVINARGKSEGELRALPIDALCRLNACLYLVVTGEDIALGWRMIIEWGFVHEATLTICRDDKQFSRYLDGPADVVLFAARGDRGGRSSMKSGYFMAEKGSNGLPEQLYRLMMVTTIKPYLEIGAVSYREDVQVWSEGMSVGASPVTESDVEVWAIKRMSDRIKYVMSDGIWRNQQEIAEMVGCVPATVQTILGEIGKEDDAQFVVEKRREGNKPYQYRFTLIDAKVV